MKPRTTSVLLGWSLVVAFSAGAPARADDDNRRGAPLAVRSDLSQVVKEKRRRTPRPLDRGCAVEALRPLDGRLPYGPGERLEYDIAMFGLPTGDIALSVGDRIGTGDRSVVPVYAEGSTSPLVAFMGGIDAQMVSYLDVNTQLPRKMASRVHVNRPLHDEVMIREDALFVPDDVQSHLTYRVGDKDKEWDARRAGSTDVLDVLSVLYYARSRDFAEGTRFCFEVFHRRWLWRVSGVIGPAGDVEVPFGERRARRIDAVVRRVYKKRPLKPGEKPPAAYSRAMRVWVSDDDERLPLLLSTDNETVGEVQLRLTAHTRGRPLPAKARTALSAPR